MSLGTIFFSACLAFVVGIACQSFFNVPNWCLIGLALLGLFLLGIFWSARPIVVLGICLLIFCGAVLRFQILDDIEGNHVRQYNNSEAVELVGEVGKAPDERSSKTHLEINVEAVHDEPVTGKVLVSVPRYPRYEFGDRLQLKGKLLTPAEFADFSYKDYLAKDEIYSVMYYAKVEKLDAESGNEAWKVVLNLKDVLRKSLRRSIPEPEAGFALRLLLGERKAMSDTVLEDFKKTGTMHIVAISGYHVTIVAALLIAITRGLGRRWSFIVAASVIIFYVLLTGASASVIRAAIMGILVLFAMQVGRMSSARNTIALAAVVMLLINPQLLSLDIGFQLSFLAVIGIVYLSPLLERAFTWLPNVLAFRDSVVITLSAMITTLPLGVFNFGRLAIISPLINFVLLPSIPLSMGLAFVTAVAGSINETLGQVVGWPAWLVLRYGIEAVRLGAEVPFAYLDLEKVGPEWLMIVYGLMIAVFVYRWAVLNIETLWEKHTITSSSRF
ncbi:ComEC/Rec2 family competence protein [Patescibacteria group bacterium]